MGAKELLAKAAKDAGIDEATLAAFIANESFLKQIDEAAMLRSDYSRAHDALRKEKDEFGTDKQKWLSWYDEANKTVSSLQSRVAQFEQKYGPIDEFVQNSSGGYNNMSGDYISKEDFEKALSAKSQEALQNAQMFTVNVVEATQKILRRHSKYFGPDDDPNFDEIREYCLKNNLPLEAGYDQYIAPKLTEKREADHKAEIEQAVAKAKEDTKRELISSSRIPIDPTPTELSPFNAYTKAASDVKKVSMADIMMELQSDSK